MDSNTVKIIDSIPEAVRELGVTKFIRTSDYIPYEIESKEIFDYPIKALNPSRKGLPIERFVLKVKQALVLGGAHSVYSKHLQRIVRLDEIDWHSKLGNFSNERLDRFTSKSINELCSNLQLIPGTGLLLESTWANNYFHFLTDILGKAYVSFSFEQEKSIDFIVLDNEAPYSRFWCQKLFPDVPIFKLSGRPRFFERLLVPSYCQECGGASQDLIAFLRKHTINIFPSDDKRILVARRGLRVPPFQEILVKELEKQDFKCVFFEDQPPEKQIEIGKGAGLIVGPHGAGMSNIIFNECRGKMIEFMQQEYANDCFLRMCCNLGWDHQYWNTSNGKSSCSDFVNYLAHFI